MKFMSATLLLATIFTSGGASELFVEYGQDPYNPRVAYAFGPRNHAERYLLQILQQRALPDPILDTVSKAFTDYDTANVYDLLAKKDGRRLVSALDRVVVQTFLFDLKLIRSLVPMDSIYIVSLAWKGAAVNRSGGGVSLAFGMYKGHVFGVLNDMDSVAADTVFYAAPGPFIDQWAAEECHITLTFQRNDSAMCEIQTDYLALKIRYENNTHTIIGVSGSANIRKRGKNVILYTLDNPSAVGISVFTPGGALVHQYQNSREPAGSHSWIWNECTASGKRAPAGLYYIRVKSDMGNTGFPFVLR